MRVWRKRGLCSRHIGAAMPDEARPNALEAVSKALEMDDELEEAHGAMGVIKADEWDYSGGEQECRKALELNPGYALAHVFYSNQLRHQGRTDEEHCRSETGPGGGPALAHDE